MKNITRIWNEIKRGENIGTYITTAVVLLLAIYNFFGNFISKPLPQNWINVLVLIILEILLISSLNTTHYFKDLLIKLSSQSSNQLKCRVELLPLQKRGENASEIIVVGVSLASVKFAEFQFFEHKMKEGAHLKFLLLDPSSPEISIYTIRNKIPGISTDINNTLNSLKLLVNMQKSNKGKCEIRLSKVSLPVSLVACFYNNHGTMAVEIQEYKKNVAERPHIELSSEGNPEWFEYFKSQYEQLWLDSTKWPSDNK